MERRPGLVRLRVLCRGTVQGVGFRPAVHRLATGLGLAGWVLNGPEGVTIEVEGPAEAAELFWLRLPVSLPPLARLDSVERAEIAAQGEVYFSVRSSEPGARRSALVPPDAALCPECRADMERPADRRYRYPFTTCTNCGPRFSLVHELPYDRERTAMACFALCPECRREYEDPSDRRFHAEPVCCPACGPHLRLLDGRGANAASGSDALHAGQAALLDGAVVAVKGLGGFQLACRADSEEAVTRLRERKRRPTKPFAVMVGGIAEAGRIVRLGPEDRLLLESARAPALLAPRIAGSPVASSVAPGLEDLGVLLPTTPLHVELFRGLQVAALVMTSGNVSDEPICRENREALGRLGALADLFLVHDRDVVRRVDDTVARSDSGGPFLIRRARGYVPEPLPLPCEIPEPALALGGYLAVTACLATGRQAFLSQHVGDLDGEPARLFLREVARELEAFLQAHPTVLVADLHPDYPSSWLAHEWAADRGGRVLGVQHHLAHAAATLAEQGRFPGPGGTALAIALDGTGWGPDGTSWGGEWLEVNGSGTWKRLAHLDPIPLVGGERAVLEPWRVAVAALALSGASDLAGRLPLVEFVSEGERNAVARMSDESSWPRASGAGRLFEAAGALLGLCASNGWEGEAAARLEALAASAPPTPPWPEVALAPEDGPPRLPSASLLRQAAERVIAGEAPHAVAAGFHSTFCALAADLLARVAPEGHRAVALGGGCLVNRLLRQGLRRELAGRGFEPLLPVNVPPGDGGLAYGQAVLAGVALHLGLDQWLLERA